MNLENTLQKLVNNNLLSASAVVVKNNKIIDEFYFGKMSIEKNELVDENTIFRIASISKIVVAMAVMKLIEENKASLDDDISNILGFKIRNPQFINTPITIKMLMLHTSSITDGYYDNDIRGYNGVNVTTKNVSLQDLLIPNHSEYYTEKTYSNYEPGTNFIYSNFNTGILSCIVEALSGVTFTKYVETNFFKPLKIDASFKANQIKNQDKIASLYYKKNNEFLLARDNVSFVNNTYPTFDLKQNYRGPAGGLFISLKDLSKMMIALMNDGKYKNIQLLQKETVDLMLQMHYLGSNQDYSAKGLQMRHLEINNFVLKGHTGNAYGLRSLLFFNKEENIGICFATNGGNFKDYNVGLNDVALEVLTSFINTYETKSNHTFKMNLNDKVGYFDNRKIIFSEYLEKNDDLYLYPIDLANMLNIVPIINDSNITIKYNDNIITLPIINNKVSLKLSLNELNINYIIDNNNLKLFL